MANSRFQNLPKAPNLEIDHYILDREPIDPQGAPLVFTMENIQEWSSEHRGGDEDRPLPLVVRRELYRGVDKNTYCHRDFWALYFVRRGRGTHVINGHAWSMARGNIYLLAPDSVHHYLAGADVVLDAVYFGESLFSEDEQNALGELTGSMVLTASARLDRENLEGAPQTLPGHFLHLSPQRQLTTEEAFARIRDELSRPERALHLSARSRLWCLLVELTLWRAEVPVSTRGGENRELGDILQYCETHFMRDLSVEQLATSTNFSRNHFTRLFTQEVGMPPATYLRHLRLQHAQKLLRETRHSAGDVAIMCGFSDLTVFSRAFGKSFGVSPGAYRKSVGGGRG